jgi:hypothetical protein
MRILLVLLLSLVFGAGLIVSAEWLPVRPGLFGAGLMVLAALATRRRWLLLADAAPGSPERALWIGFAGTAVVAAHLFAVMLRIGPNLIMHTPEIHALGIDNWTLVAGAVIAHWIARDPEPRQDERDAAIAVAGLRAAHYGLLAMLALQILALGFVREGWVGALSHPSIAHALILAVMASVLIDHGWRLHRYACDAALDAAE